MLWPEPQLPSASLPPSEPWNEPWENDEGDNDNNDNNDDDNGNEKTYCDVPNPSNPCHDRKDYSDDTGLYTCIDGSHEEDWRDCEGGGAGDDNDNDSDNGNGDSDDLPQEG